MIFTINSDDEIEDEVDFFGDALRFSRPTSSVWMQAWHEIFSSGLS